LVWSFSLFAHWRCWWMVGPLWKWGEVTYTLKLLFGPLSKNSTCTYSCCWWPLWKQGTYMLHLLFGAPLKATYLHITTAVGSLLESKKFYITVAVGGPFERIVPTHYNCCLGPLWKQGTYTLQLLIAAPLKASYLHIAVAVGDPFESRVLTHCNCCWESLWKQSILHCSYCWAPLKSE